MKFFNIVKANAEIEKLETQVTALTGEVATLKENAPQIEAAAETLRTEKAELSSKLDQAESDLATAKQTISTLTNEKADVAKQLAEANAKLANPGEVIKQTASAQAAAIVASVGQPAIAATPTTDPAQEQKPELKGRARYDAAIKIIQ
jgi:chromosome segregation ATPase